MAAQYTEVTLDEMDRYLKRGWRSMRPKQGNYKGELCYDLFLSPDVSVRVLTSIGARSSSGAGVGEDAIRVSLFMPKKNRPMLTGKFPIVKRTQGWKGNLQDRIEDFIEMYEDREGYFEQRAGGEVPEQAKPSAPSIMDSGRRDEEDEGNRAERELAEREMEYERQEEERRQAPRRTDLRATFQTLRNGDWGLRIQGDAQPGDEVVATTKAGRSQRLTVGEVLWRGDGVTVTTIARSPRTAGEGLLADEETYSYEREG